MGDLVLTESEIGPVMAKLRAAGFEITAIHNHLLNETPHVMYMHYMGHGTAQKIAQALRDALAESKTPFTSAPPAQEAPPAPFVKTIEGVLGTQGRWAGGVLAFGLPRKEPIMDHGMTLNGAQGVAEAINFQEAGEGKVATTGDFVLIEQEVNSVISALEEHGIQVTALHNHMLDEQPRLLFMHFWAVGTPERVSTGIKAALSKIAVK
jgi:biotin operon repressor